MRTTLSKIKNSVLGMLGPAPGPTNSTLHNRCEDIREAMLTVLDQCGTDRRASAISNRVCYASDIEALWYLRSAILTKLIANFGEPQARAMLRPITQMFKGHLPAGLEPPTRPRRKGE